MSNGTSVGDLLNRVLPTLVVPWSSEEFNVFDVMHHGTHEKQLSNVFAWLLDEEGSHRLDDRFLSCFLDEVNVGLSARGEAPVRPEAFVVEQEQNTRSTREGADIADIVLRGERTALVIENYHISDGHGHDYKAYYDHGKGPMDGRSVVVMLCDIRDDSLLRDGWEHAVVITYSNLLYRLLDDIGTDPNYPSAHPEQFWFLSQMKQHFLKGKRVNDDTSLEFIRVLCETGEARRYGTNGAAASFADFLRSEAQQKFEESQALLNRLKKALQTYLDANLGRLNDALGEGYFGGTYIRFQGIYQWDVSLLCDGEVTVFVLFGPSAWADNELNKYKSWEVRIDEPDYSRLVIGYGPNKELRQSSVTMEDILNGLAPDDTRLLDEIVSAVRGI